MKTIDFINLYHENKKFWYIVPRAQYFHEQNVSEFQAFLAFLKKYQYVEYQKSKYALSKSQDLFQPEIKPTDLILEIWDQDTQMLVQKAMIEQKIIKPTKSKEQTKNDTLANFRNHINLCRKLGFAYINREKRLFISDMGLEFLNAQNMNEIKNVFEKQIRRLQFSNPSINFSEETDIREYLEFKIFPYFYTIELILSLKEKHLTVDEYILFVSFAKNHKDIPISKKLINAFRSLTHEKQQKVIKEANISQPHKTQGNVTLGVFGISQTFKYHENKVVMIDESYARLQLDTIYKEMYYVEYQTFEEWFYYMGRYEEIVSSQEVIAQYVRRGETEKAEQFVETIDDRKEREKAKKQTKELLKEKEIEDILKNNISLLGEEGLKVVQNQYKTEVSLIDILCTDSEGYVVLELKRGRTSDDVVGQILRYMGWVRDNMTPEKIVRGIIVIAHETVDLKIKKAVRGIQRNDELIKIILLDINPQGILAQKINLLS